MSRALIGIVDYGVGNLASLISALSHIGLKTQVGKDRKVLETTDILFLPGVGSFPYAMNSLRKYGLTDYLMYRASQQRPIVGICLGMQLLAGCSHEYSYTEGLNIIPGEVVPLAGPGAHIGWNAIESEDCSNWIQSSIGLYFYFNHSYVYRCANEYEICKTKFFSLPFPSIIQYGQTVGLQFHPEKSQSAGINLLKNLVAGLLDA